MTPWPGCRPRRIRPRSEPDILLWKCLLDGEAYAFCFRRTSLRKNQKTLRFVGGAGGGFEALVPPP